MQSVRCCTCTGVCQRWLSPHAWEILLLRVVQRSLSIKRRSARPVATYKTATHIDLGSEVSLRTDCLLSLSGLQLQSEVRSSWHASSCSFYQHIKRCCQSTSPSSGSSGHRFFKSIFIAFSPLTKNNNVIMPILLRYNTNNIYTVHNTKKQVYN